MTVIYLEFSLKWTKNTVAKLSGDSLPESAWNLIAEFYGDLKILRLIPSSVRTQFSGNGSGCLNRVAAPARIRADRHLAARA